MNPDCRIKFLLLDQVVHTMFVICGAIDHSKIGQSASQGYLKKDGPVKFQVDLVVALLNYAIRDDWQDLDGDTPDWMRQNELIPWACGKCFFCLNGSTTGIAHKRKQKLMITFVQYNKTHMKAKGCTDVHVNLEAGNQNHRICMRKLRSGTEEERVFRYKDKKRQCTFSHAGCPSCKEHICND
jgi:hypothetical protein